MCPDVDPAQGRLSYAWNRLLRHVGWLRSEGLPRLVEEDGLNVAARWKLHRDKRNWLQDHGHEPGGARPIFIVGAQRSGTNMLLRGLEASPELEVHSENDRRNFERFRIREDHVIYGTVMRSRHTVVLFKPLCDSHRTQELLDIANPDKALALWIYRGVDARTRSAVAKFGSDALEAVQRIASGQTDGLWQAGGLAGEDIDLVRSLPLHRLTPTDGAALLWFLRNSLYFTLGLNSEKRVHLLSYEAFISDPADVMQRICSLIEVEYRSEFIGHVDAGRSPRITLAIDPTVRELCDALADRLNREAQLATGN